MEPKKDTIEAGIVSNMLKKLGKLFGDAFVDTLKDLDKEIKDVRRNADGGILGTKFCEDSSLRPYKVKFDDIEIHDDGTAEGSLSFQDPSGEVYPNVITLLWKKKDVENPDENVPEQEDNEVDSESDSNFAENTEESSNNQITNKDIATGNVELVNRDEFDAVIDKFEDTVMTRFPIESSINIKLKKIVGSDETSVDLIGICTECPPTTTLDNLNTVLDDSDFVASMPDNEECSYSITDTGDDLVVEPFDGSIDESDSTILKTLLADLVVISDNIRFLRDNCSNTTLSNTLISEADWKIQDDITDITSYIAICGDQIPNHGDLKSNIPYYSIADDPNTSYLCCVNDIINEYKLYNLSICNPEIRQGLDSKLLSWEQTLTSVR